MPEFSELLTYALTVLLTYLANEQRHRHRQVNKAARDLDALWARLRTVEDAARVHGWTLPATPAKSQRVE